MSITLSKITIPSFLTREDAATSVEYGLMIFLIAVAVVAAFQSFTPVFTQAWGRISELMASATTGNSTRG